MEMKVASSKNAKNEDTKNNKQKNYVKRIRNSAAYSVQGRGGGL